MKKVLITLGIILTINALISAIINSFVEPTNSYYYTLKFTQKALMVILTIAVIVRANLTNEIKNKGWIPSLIGVGVLVYAIYIAYTSTTEISMFTKISFVAHCIAVGFFEELLFRIFVYFKLRELYSKATIFKTILIASSIFAVAHLTNMLQSDVVKITVLNQVIVAMGIGMILQIVYLKLKNILLIATLHASFNILGSFKSRFDLNSASTEAFTTQDFLFTMITLLIIVLVIITPIVYLYAKNMNLKEGVDNTTATPQ